MTRTLKSHARERRTTISPTSLSSGWWRAGAVAPTIASMARRNGISKKSRARRWKTRGARRAH